MYTQFFGLNQAPFSIAPDPRYLFMSERHREALAHLLYGVGGGGGFVLLTGEIGAGKTTVCRCFLEQIPSNCNVAYIFNPKLTVNELLKSVCDEFHIRFQHQGGATATVKEYVDALNAYLLGAHAEGRNNVLIIDEAQNLSADVLEQLRLLTNLETNERKLLQIILIGQPELRTMLARPELEQLAQRVIARYHLGPLSLQETERYILHRLSIAGLIAASPFQKKMVQKIYQLTQGVPRRINLLCDRMLLGAYVENKREVDSGIMKKAAAEVFGNARGAAPVMPSSWPYTALGLAAGVAIAGATAWAMHDGAYLKMFASGKSALAAMANMPSIASPAAPGNLPSKAAAAPASMPAGSAPVVASVMSDLSGTVDRRAQDANIAYRELAQLWGVPLPDDNACQAAQKKDLHCYQSGGGMAELRQLDRPAILTLRDNANKTYYAVLTGLTNVSATLQIGGTPRTVSLVALNRRFQGDFATFWRAPQSYRGQIGLGDRGAEVDWLAAQLAKLNGLPKPVAQQAFDQAMSRQVREFQLAQGLEVDGIVGPKTYMHFNSIAAVDEPHLRNGPANINAASGK